MKTIYAVLLTIFTLQVQAQVIKAKVVNKRTHTPIEYVNVGIEGKNIGTTCDSNGNFSIVIDSIYNNDLIKFSCIGYQPTSIKVADFRKRDISIVELEPKTYNIAEIVIKPTSFKQKNLGISTKSKIVATGFTNNNFGYECGILMKCKKTAFLKKINININTCTFDTLFYRINVYKQSGDLKFENILQEPIYIKVAKNKLKEVLQIDISTKNIVVDGNFLITLEHVRNLGSGRLFFCARLGAKTYYRKTSQASWLTAPVGMSLSVIADVEQ